MIKKTQQDEYARMFYEAMIEEQERMIAEIESAIERMRARNRKAYTQLFILLVFLIFTLIWAARLGGGG